MKKGLTDINFLFFKYYHDNPELRRIVMAHSAQVARKALEICNAKNLKLDRNEVFCAAMLHDIGVVNCDAPDIFAKGEKPYLQHGLEGEKILKENGLSKFAGVCSHHTGSGISKDEINEKRLPLPAKDFLPTTLIEKLICYADKFFSKSGDLTREKSLEEVMQQMKKFGDKSYTRFLRLHETFG